MFQPSCSLSFTTEPLERLGLGHMFRVQDLDRHLIANKQSCGAINGAHASRAKLAVDAVFPLNCLADESRFVRLVKYLNWHALNLSYFIFRTSVSWSSHETARSGFEPMRVAHLIAAIRFKCRSHSAW